MSIALRTMLMSLLCLLAACSLGADEPQTRATGVPRPTSEAAQPARTLPGRLLYVRDDQIWMHSGTEVRELEIDGNLRDPAWSPDGSRIAFIRRDESFSDLYVFNVETGQATQVTDNGSSLQPRTLDYVHQIIWAAKPTWSPDGQEIVYLSQEQPATQAGQQPAIYEFPMTLYRYETRLIGTRQPNNNDILPVGQQDADKLAPTWSPDGRYLAYVQASRDEEPRRIMRYDFTTELAEQFPGTPDGAYDPAWSPDGSMLAFAAGQDGATDIWMVEAAGTGSARRLTNLGRARAPEWSPDGTMIAFVHVGDNSSDLYTLELTQEDGQFVAGEPVALTEGVQIDATAGLSWGR